MNQPSKVVHFNPDNPEHVQLKDAVYSIQKKHNKGTLCIWVSLEKALRLNCLDDDYTPADILRECYYEGLCWIEQGGNIDNPIAWIRYASYRRITLLGKIHKCDRA